MQAKLTKYFIITSFLITIFTLFEIYSTTQPNNLNQYSKIESIAYDYQANQSDKGITVTSYRVIDGDTAEFTLESGETIKGRFLLIDTPELNHRQQGEQPYAVQAKNRLQELLDNSNSVTLTHDIGAKTDRYDRELVYVWIDGILVQEILTREGLARVAYVYPPNTKYLEELKKAEQQAKIQSLNIWSNTLSGIDETHTIAPYTTIKSVHYKNCKEVRDANAAPIYPSDPGWDPKFDRDKNGIGCESYE